MWGWSLRRARGTRPCDGWVWCCEPPLVRCWFSGSSNEGAGSSKAGAGGSSTCILAGEVPRGGLTAGAGTNVLVGETSGRGRSSGGGTGVCGSRAPAKGAACIGARGTTGVNFLRNRLFRKVTRPEPSTRMTYWSNCLTSMTTPVLSHFIGWGPVWFWIRTASPMTRAGRWRVCSVKRSESRRWRCRSAISLEQSVSCHVGWGWYLPGCMGIKSLIWRPKTHIAGDSPVSLSGVFLYWSMARWKGSDCSFPSAPRLPERIRLTVFTPSSARQLLCGNATEEMRCLTPHAWRNRDVWWEENSGPPSEESSSLIP